MSEQGSPSNPNPVPNQPLSSPGSLGQHHRGNAPTPPASPPSSRTQTTVISPAVIAPPQPRPPVMGVPGQSAFSRFIRPGRQSWPLARGSSGERRGDYRLGGSGFESPSAGMQVVGDSGFERPSAGMQAVAVVGGNAMTPPASPHSSRTQTTVVSPAVIAPPQPRLPVMGVPGQSAFSRFIRPGRQSWPPARGSSGGRRGDYGLRGSGFEGPSAGMQAVAVVGSSNRSGGASMGEGPSRVPSSTRMIGLKRAREGEGTSAGSGEASPEEVPKVACSVCGKNFNNNKALFGHMRTHPDRGWRGAHPPPVFKAEEEFADIPGGLAAIDSEGSAALTEAEGEQMQAGTGAEVQDVDKDKEEGSDNYNLPDLNNPPPADDSASV